ncbi:v-myb avian myeloblastosis viral oncogene homolog-like 2a [Polypterus senegalus]|uniref:v-myb avian myeloblastosis viral oncogene homolog-like 2a n=1 Tax=Polypterus senegalus TaxID=55291 RepID=UPI0019668445|nr:v-myb avian myeloblastosis viral oncogene homolog-like 2a [Polypterus senegalus]
MNSVIIKLRVPTRQNDALQGHKEKLQIKKRLTVERIKSECCPTVPSVSNVRNGCSPNSTHSRQKSITQAILRMIAEDMLPLNFVEGAGFRNLMTIVEPRYPHLSQRTIGLKLYDQVEKIFKPSVIKELKKCMSYEVADAVIHTTVDVWSSRKKDQIIGVRFHYFDDEWNIRHPTVAVRHVCRKNVNTAVAQELESVFLSYGLFPQNIGYVVTGDAKNAIAEHDLFCDYRVICSGWSNNPVEEEVINFLNDVLPPEDECLDIHIGTHLCCFTYILHLIIKDALKASRAVQHVLSQMYNMASFFCRSAYWIEVLASECDLTLALPSSEQHCCWNFTFDTVRKLAHEPVWKAVMKLVSQAHIKAKDASTVPPVVRAKREQVLDIIGLLEPFEEATRVLQTEEVTFSLIIPSLIKLDKALENRETQFSSFCKALRTGLQSKFQALLQHRDLILATVVDPRFKLQPFEQPMQENGTSFLVVCSRCKAKAIVESAIRDFEFRGSKDDDTKQDITEDVGDNPTVANNFCTNRKRKPRGYFFQPCAKTFKMSELDLYLNEGLLDWDTSPQSFWRDEARFPQLRNIARKLLAIPATSGGFRRLFPIAGCVTRAHKNKLPPHTTERLILFREAVRCGEHEGWRT